MKAPSSFRHLPLLLSRRRRWRRQLPPTLPAQRVWLLLVFWMLLLLLLLSTTANALRSNDNSVHDAAAAVAARHLSSEKDPSTTTSSSSRKNMASVEDTDNSSIAGTETNTPHQHAIVVGGGLSGLAVALGLSNMCDCTVDVIEKRQSFGSQQGSTLGVAPNGLKALQELVQSTSSSSASSSSVQTNENDEGDDDIASILKGMGLSIPINSRWESTLLCWWMVRDELLRRCQADPNICIHMGWTLAQPQNGGQEIERSIIVETAGGRVQATFVSTPNGGDATATATKTFEGSFLIGADGVNSATRKWLLNSSSSSSSEQKKSQHTEREHSENDDGTIHTGVIVWRGTVVFDHAERLEEVASTLFANTGSNDNERDKRKSAFFLGIGPTSVSVFNHPLVGTDPLHAGVLTWVIAMDTNNDKSSNTNVIHTILDGKETPHAILEDGFASDNVDQKIVVCLRAVLSRADQDDLHRPIEMKVVKPHRHNEIAKEPNSINKRWGGKGRVTLIGDAAHALRPVAGQGSAMAFEDCVVLCRQLRDVMSTMMNGNNYNNNLVEDALASFEEERHDRVKRIWDWEWKQATNFYKTKKLSTPSTDYIDWLMDGI